MRTIAFRVDAGPSIGMGHLMRCLTLAEEFIRSGCEVHFISKYENGIQALEERGLRVWKLSCDKKVDGTAFNYGNPEELDKEIEEIQKLIEKRKLDILVIDSYNVSEDYFLRLKSCACRLVYIDDLNKFIYPVDVLINGNISADRMNYEKYSEEEELLLGVKYNLIRSEFSNLPARIIKKSVKEIMITTGGADPYGMTRRILDCLLGEPRFQGLKFNVVVGNNFTRSYVQVLRNLSLQNNNIRLFENVQKMSAIMLRSDIAISAAGGTLNELCACGTPTIAFIVADNQVDFVNSMQEEGYIDSIGWFNTFRMEELVQKVEELCCNFDLRRSQSEKMRALIDGKGPKRIVEDILNL